MNKSSTGSEQVMSQLMKKLWRKVSEQFMKKQLANHEQVMSKSQTSHEQAMNNAKISDDQVKVGVGKSRSLFYEQP